MGAAVNRLTRDDIQPGAIFVSEFRRPWSGKGLTGWHAGRLLCQVTAVHEARFDWACIAVLDERDAPPNAGDVSRLTGGAAWTALAHPELGYRRADTGLIPDAIADAGREMHRLGLGGLFLEQVECLDSPSRYDEMLDMLDDFQARLGFDRAVATRIIDRLAEAHGFGSPNGCDECERSNGPHYTGPCPH
jgi:hypothetical protein